MEAVLATIVKYLWGFILVVMLPFIGWLGKKGFNMWEEKLDALQKQLDNLSDKHVDSSERIEDHIDNLKDKDFELQSKIIQLEASSVSRNELLEHLSSLESSLEARFDRSFTRLEETVNKIIDKLDRH